jgi:NAD(P)H-flavin reductase
MAQKQKECQDTAGMVLNFLKDDLEVKAGQLQHFLQVWFKSGVGRPVSLSRYNERGRLAYLSLTNSQICGGRVWF